jgi:hypothetical protein
MTGPWGVSFRISAVPDLISFQIIKIIKRQIFRRGNRRIILQIDRRHAAVIFEVGFSLKAFLIECMFAHAHKRRIRVTLSCIY